MTHIYSDGTDSISLGTGQDGEHYRCLRPENCDCICDTCLEAKEDVCDSEEATSSFQNEESPV